MRSHFLRPRFVLSLLIVLPMLLLHGTAAAQRRAGESAPVTGGTVTLHVFSGPETLNLITSSDAFSQEVQGLLYEPLVIIDPFTLEPLPWIAEDLPTVSADRLVYDYRLRRDATFSDGHPVTADDFIFFLKAVKNPRIPNAAPLRGYYSRVRSAGRIDGDPYRLRVTMKESYYLAQAFIGGLSAFPKHVWDPEGFSDAVGFAELEENSANPAIARMAAIIDNPSKDFSARYLTASGPYVFSRFRQDQDLLLLRNPNYWNQGHPLGKAYPDTLLYRIDNENSGFNLLKNGAADFSTSVRAEQVAGKDSMLARLGLRAAVHDYPAYTYVGYNHRTPLFSDRRVRMAFSHTIDCERAIRNLFFGFARTVQSPVFHKRPEYDSTLPEIPFDMEKARMLLEEAGWRDSDDDGLLDRTIDGEKTDFRFTILTNDSYARVSIALMMADQLKPLGIEATIEKLQWPVFLERIRSGDYDAFISGWAMSATEGDLYQTWHSSSAGGGSNHVSYSNPELDRVIEAIRSEHDFARRIPLYRQAQRIIYEDQPYTFLFSSRQIMLYRDRLQNVRFYAPRPGYNPGMWWVRE